ncbi:MAG: adenylate kinase [Pseudomonadota bacterium]
MAEARDAARNARADAPPLDLVLLGPPGAGKGTQARRLTQAFGLVQLSTGELLRAATAAGSPAGQAAQAVMTAGGLVPDATVIAVVEDRLALPDTAAGVIFDGFPRTIAQAEALDGLLRSEGRQLGLAISMEVDDALMIERISGRFTCATCGEGYHDRFKRPQIAGVCDVCESTSFTRRTDDTPGIVRDRLQAYHAETAPLLAHYAATGRLARVDAMTGIDAIADALGALLRDHTGLG